MVERRIEATTQINASAARVWAILTDFARMIAISLFFGGLNFALFFVGLGQGLASVSAVANQLSTPFTVLLAWPLLGERLSPRVIIGVALAFPGVALTAAEPSASVKILPTLLVVATGFALAVGSVLAKRYGPFEPMKLLAWMSVFAVPQVMAASFLIEHGQLASLHTASLTAWLAFGYTVVFGAASVAGDLRWVSRAIWTAPREAARTRRACGIRTQ